MEIQYTYDSMKSKRIERAVEIAAEMFLQNGIDTVKMTDIADACGVGVATLYRYFGTKTAITIAAMTYLWNKLRGTYEHMFETESFLRQTGIKRLADLMRMYLVLFDTHKDMMRLVANFDLMLRHENVPKSELFDYERSIINFYSYMESAYMVGVADGTVRTDIDFKMFYLTFGHSMLALSQKLLCGELLPSDDFNNGKIELEMLIAMAVRYLRKECADEGEADRLE